MALPVRDQLRYWGIAAAVFLLLLWSLGNVLLPFVLGGALAYLLDPIADRLQRLGLSRVLATVTITAVALMVVVLVFLLLVPALLRQGAELLRFSGALVQGLPERVIALEAWLAERFPGLDFNEAMLREQLVALGQTLQASAGGVVSSVLTSAMSLVNALVLILVVPVVTFYLLMDWDRMVAHIDSLLPRDHAPVIRRLAAEIDRTLAAFLRGMGTVSLILGSFYAVALALIGVPFGLFVGLFAGLVTFIPYVGAILGGTLAVGLAMFQFWGDWFTIGLVALVFMAGQFAEGNFLTPRLVGSSVGLHPVWLIFALSVFGSLFGFLGLLVAVPVAAMIGVVARFLLERYKAGLLYRGRAATGTQDDAAPDGTAQDR